jgi:ABC-type transport system substrate-binding protein
MKSRFSRRRGLALAAAGASAAAILAACGGSDDGGGDGGGGKASGYLVQPKDSTSQAKTGGIWQKYRSGVVYHFDPMDTNNGANPLPVFAYNQPVKINFGTVDSPPDGSFVGDAAESWEVSDGGLTVTFKLRPGVKLDPRAPTNGRELTSADWLYSWQKFVAQAPQAGELSAEKSPGAPVLRWEAPDAKTIVMKMAYPYAPLLTSLSDSRIAFSLVPTEHDGKYDAHVTTRGGGPFMLQNYVPDSKIEWVRNPNYWDKPRPYLDGITEFLITEYSQRLAQFKSGSLWTADVNQDDVFATKNEIPKLDAWLAPFPLIAPRFIGFGWKPESPFQDVRVRQAMSMLLDREGLMEYYYNLERYQDQGIETDIRQHTLISAADVRFWVDPTSKDIGDGSKNFEYNTAEAAKLLKAANAEKLEFPFNWPTPTTNPDEKMFQAVAEMFNSSGLVKANPNPVEVKQYKATIELYWHGTHDGIADFPGGSAADPDITMTRYQENSPFKMFPDKTPMDALLKQQRQEVDLEKRKALWKQIQQQWASNVTDMGGIIPGLARTISLAWPYFGNYAAIAPWTPPTTTNPIEAFAYYWYDESKKA